MLRHTPTGSPAIPATRRCGEAMKAKDHMHGQNGAGQRIINPPLDLRLADAAPGGRGNNGEARGMTLYWVALWAAVIISMVGQGLLKAGAGEAGFMTQLFDWHTLLGLVLYGGSALCYIVALRRIPVSVALPCTAISYVAAALMGHFLFDEVVGAAHIAAIVLIIAGVGLLTLA